MKKNAKVKGKMYLSDEKTTKFHSDRVLMESHPDDMKHWSFKYVMMDMTNQLLKYNTKERQRDLHQKRFHPWY